MIDWMEDVCIPAGAAAVIIVNSDDTHNVLMTSPEYQLAVNIPQIIISSTDGQLIIDTLLAGKKMLTGKMWEEFVVDKKQYTHSNLYMSDNLGLK
jgi:hypothetical protein